MYVFFCVFEESHFNNLIRGCCCFNFIAALSFNKTGWPWKFSVELKMQFYNNQGEWSSKLGNWKESFSRNFWKVLPPFNLLTLFEISGQSSATIYHRLREHKLWQCQRFPEGLLSSSQGRHKYGGGLPKQVRARPNVRWSPQEGKDASLIFLCKFFSIISI